MDQTYYAVSSPRGVRVVYNAGNPPQVYDFDSEKLRDQFVDEKNDELDDPFNLCFEAIEKKEAFRYNRPADHIVLDGTKDEYGRWIGHYKGYQDCEVYL